MKWRCSGDDRGMLRAWPRLFAVLPLLLVACESDVDDLFNNNPSGGGGSGANGGDASGPGAGPSNGGSPDGGAPQGAGPQGGNPTPTVGGMGTGGAPSFCGDGTIDAGEDCDGADLGGQSCFNFGFTNSNGLSCDNGCQLDPDGCQPTCDGLAAEPGEACDGDDLEGFDCTDFGSDQPGGLACLDDCSDFSTALCSGECGNGAIEQGEQCDDGGTVGGDGCSATCQIEDPTCPSAIPIDLGFGSLQIAGDTTAGSTAFTTANALCPAGAAGPSAVFVVTAQEQGFLTAWLDRNGTAFDSVLYAQTACGNDATTILCADNSAPLSPLPNFGGEVVSFPVLQGDVVYLVVDSIAPASQGAFSLTIDLSAGFSCNDPVPLPVWSGSPQTVLGFTNGQSQSTGGSCGGGGTGSGSTDVVYRIERATATITGMSVELPASLTDFDSVLYGRFDCGSNEIVCDDSASPMGGEQISLPFVNNNIRYVWVDGFNGDAGSYALTVTATP